MVLKQHQEPLDIEKQIENLKELGLIIDDENKAKHFLNDVSYFRFIKAYSIEFKNKNSKYFENTHFDDIKELYLFNSRFRQSLFKQIERIEVNFRCRLANYFSYKYGVLGYLNEKNFINKSYHEKFINDIEEEIKRNSKSPFVRNFQNNYIGGCLPMYALVELFSFGMLSKFYKNMKNEDKKEIAKSYNIAYTYLESWLEHIAFIRNICAHYGRIYNVKFVKTPALYKEYSKQGIENIKIYATLLCIKHLIKNDRNWREFVEEIELFFEKYSSVKLYRMGFPENWKEILLK